MKQNAELSQKWPEIVASDGFSPELAQYALAQLSENETTAQKEKVIAATPEIIDHHTPAGATRVRELLQQCKEGLATFDPDPYEAAHAELVEFAGWMEAVPETSEAVIEHMISVLSSATPEIPESEIRSLLEATSISQDLATMAQEARKLGGSLEKIESDSRWIWFPEDKLLVKMIGQDAYYLLTVKSRAVGLIPFRALDKLRNLRIRCAGASAVVHLLDLLSGLGAENMEWWDAGKADPSNVGRLGRVGQIKHLGRGKASSLQTELLHAYPYANFRGSQGKVVREQTELETAHDITYDDFLSGAELVIEVIDNAQGKIDIRLHIKRNQQETKVVYLADVSDAFVRIEDTASENHFGQGLPETHFTSFSEQFAQLQQLPDSPEKKAKLGMLNLQAVVHMLYKQFPPEHQLQFLYIIGGLTPFWAQTAISARESAAIGSRLLLELLLDQQDAVDSTHTSDTVNHSFFPGLTPRQLETQRKLFTQLFGVPLALYEE